jgi:hypothetical protein
MEARILDLLKSIESLVEKSIHTTMTEEKATDIYAITNELMCLLIGKNDTETIEFELKSKSLHEIIQKCQSLDIDPKKTKITYKIFEDISYPDEYYAKLYLKYKK